MISLLRGLRHRAGSAAMILAVALVAAAAAATAPTYYEAARSSIVQDDLHAVNVSGRGLSATQSGSLADVASALPGTVDYALGAMAGKFAPPIQSLDTRIAAPAQQLSIPLSFRTGVCGQLTVHGRCPTAANQVMISASLARITGWRPGQRLNLPGWPAFTLTGIYAPPSGTADYWFGAASRYFPYEYPSGLNGGGPSEDAMFTPESTITASSAQGSAEVDLLLIPSRVHPADVTGLAAAMNGMLNSAALANQQVSVQTLIPQTMTFVQDSWSSLLTPVLLITAQLLVLAWLLLFLVVTEAVEARGPEIALAKLRGYGRLRTVGFGLAEPAALLALALPAGALVSWGVGAALAGSLLRPGTPVDLPALSWAAGALATLGGFAAVAIGARRTLRRPVLEQWRHAGRRGADRGWVLDAILLTAAAAGLADLGLNGQFASGRHSALALLVPGLLGLAVALVASRVLPLACRAGIARTRRAGGAAWFLALRHVARRPGGVRTTMTLATSFALAMFAAGAYLVAQANYRALGQTAVGAPTVLTVSVPAGRNLGRVVDGLDPGGRSATAVDVFYGGAVGGPQTVVAVDPARFAHVALWSPRLGGPSIGSIASRIAPPEPAPVVLTGSAVRVSVSIGQLPAGSDFGIDVSVPTGFGRTRVDLGPLPGQGTVNKVASLPGCPCVLDDFYVDAPVSAQTGTYSGKLVVRQLVTDPGGVWTRVPGNLDHPSRWRAGVNNAPPDRLAAVEGGLGWSFKTSVKNEETLISVNRPDPLPAVVAAPVTGGHTGPFGGVGLDGTPLPMTAVAALAGVPAAPGNGVIVDRKYAELAAGGNLVQTVQQVWTTTAAAPRIERGLRADGIRVSSVATASRAAAMLNRQGPGLATVLFLGDAAAATVLAAAGAILGLYAAARRRRYEYAALEAAGLSWRTLWRSLLAEELLVLTFGAAVGIATGVAAAVLTTRNVPEFVTAPSGGLVAASNSGLGGGSFTRLLSFSPPGLGLGIFVGVALALLLIAGLVASLRLIRGVRLEQLREAAP